MKSYIVNACLILSILAVNALGCFASDKDEAIKKYHLLYEGTWKVVALRVNGVAASELDARQISVVNGSDGTWILRVRDKEISRGTSVIDPTTMPKVIDFTPTDGSGKDNRSEGIYELTLNTRTLCFSPHGKARPIAFDSAVGSESILVVFERQ